MSVQVRNDFNSHVFICLFFCLFVCYRLRLRKVWQKRKCTAKNGYLTISHGTVRKHTWAHTHTLIFIRVAPAGDTLSVSPLGAFAG